MGELGRAVELITAAGVHLERVARAQDQPDLLERAAGLREAVEIIRSIPQERPASAAPEVPADEQPKDDPLADLIPVATYRTSEVARMFNVTDRTITNWVHSGRLRAVRTLGGHLRFSAADLAAARARAG